MFIHTKTLPSIAAAVLICTSLCGAEDPIDEPVSLSPLKGNRIAIIGGGISGTFTAKYLAEYDARGRGSKKCLIDEIDIFDVSPPPFSVRSPRDDATIQSSADPRPPTWQGSRVSTLQLNDGSTIELGASIIYSGNKLVVKLMEGDPDNLVKSPPMSTGKKKKPDIAQSDEEKSKDKKIPSGFGIYHGMKEWLIKPSHYLPSFIPKFLHPILKKYLQPLYFLWRYSTDYFRLRHAVKRAVHAFDLIYELLEDDQHEVTFFESPMDIWDAIGLRSVAGISFHDFLDGLGLKRCEELELEKTAHGSYGGFWWIPGCLRSELVTAMTINTYNQDLNQMNGEYGEKVRLRVDVTDIANNCFNGDSTGLVGLVAYVPAGGELFSVEGGNYKLMKSAIRQATKIYDTSACPKLPVQRIQQHQKRITTVVSGENSMEIFSADESLGNFDIVILAAPLQQSRIQFLMESPMSMDPSVLHPMALNGIHENLDLEDNHERSPSQLLNNEHGQLAFTSPLPPSATTPYTSVVTTVVSNATLNATHFGLSENEQWPRSILVSERGKLTEGITTLTILDFERGLMKTFSSEILTTEKRNILFGSHHALEYVQVWGGGEKEEGGKYGGATPNFDGGRNSESLPFLLYDGAKHWGKGNAGSTGPALYYVNAIESSVAAIEISAIGAKSTAKLVARRLGLVNPASGAILHEEL